MGFSSCSSSLRPTSALKFDAKDFDGAFLILDEAYTLLADTIENQKTYIAKHRTQVMQAVEQLRHGAHQIFILSGTLKQIDIEAIEDLIGHRAFMNQNT
ncbi:hypothetical protein PMIT1313_02183 [Prochlorococcus marinus str. MIT 1313]|uniref:zonular occludens toxin domain-containing protein n=1 Tax=Prochlorococcus TaxID=1218 RepID=UPI0007B33580|nr:zonular occludens toxin domain-containing protein [Prochlorococcus marinus]KZR68560.1 hypothetical protein PMIT1313_02183 [Prochlorococcus marinus str. MIT 1313]KZR71202.1 hypothetical protein PMIT1318_02345 [Prochlorococcus marinus str. MIT 1318]